MMDCADKIYSFGKNNLFVNEDLVTSRGPQISGRVSDRLREFLMDYYSVQLDGKVRYLSNFEKPAMAKARVKRKNDTSVLEFKFLTEPQTEEEMEANMGWLATLIDTSTTFIDFFFKMQAPIPYALTKKMNKVGKVEYIYPRSSYNFLVNTYEKFLKNNPGISENILPSFYALYAQSVYRQSNVVPLNSLNGIFTSKSAEAESFISVLGEDGKNLRDRYSTYFKEYTQAVNKLMKHSTGPQSINSLSLTNSVYTFTDATLPLLTTEAVKGEMFPFFNKIEFSTDSQSSFSDILWELKLGEEIIKEVIKHPGVQRMKFGNSAQTYSRSRLKNEPSVEKYVFGSSTLNVWDIASWIQVRLFNNGQLPGKVIGKNRSTNNSAADQGIQNILLKTVAAAKINRLSEYKYRTLERMMGGKPAYSEAVFYRIQKFSENDSTTPISTYFIPNSSKLEECKFIDTQVKYGKKYTYIITSYVLVIGTEYSYNTFNQIDSTTVDIGIGSIPKMKLVEVPLARVDDMVVIDNPPMPPETSIVSFKNIGNKILINMNGSTGDRMMTPVIVEPSDKAKVDLQRVSQRRLGKIRFKSDDKPGSFEIFRTTERPSSFADFGGKKIRVLSTRNLSTSAAFEDKISPNKKYYYIIRSIDIHGNISNPSPIYEVEMKTTAGPPYMVLNLVNLESANMENKKPFKSMQRYVQIIPTTPQGLLNVADSPQLQDVTTAKGVTNVTLGVSDEKLWGQRFRFRFTSKKTGRKIDLDVNFNTKHQLKQS